MSLAGVLEIRNPQNPVGPASSGRIQSPPSTPGRSGSRKGSKSPRDRNSARGAGGASVASQLGATASGLSSQDGSVKREEARSLHNQDNIELERLAQKS